jgi:predicted CoA-binding protein
MELEQILRETKTIAVVGASANPSRPSYGVYRYLRTHTDYQLYPVNPTITAAGGDLAGDTVYPSLADLPVVPDMVDVFRRYEDLPSVLTEVLALPTLPKTLWLQQGLFHEQVGRDATAAGLQVVMDRCLKVDYANVIG